MTDTDKYIHQMIVSYPLLKPTMNQAIQSLKLPKGSHGLDAGCGIGLQIPALADGIGDNGQITGLDISSEFLQYANKRMRQLNLSELVSFKEGDIRELPFEDNEFDWVWSSCCAGYAASLDPALVLQEFARVVKPGGLVTIFAWSSERLLPGYPILEARLNATSPGIAPFGKGMEPELHFSRGLGWFRAAGLENLKVKTFVGDAYAPLNIDVRNAL